MNIHLAKNIPDFDIAQRIINQHGPDIRIYQVLDK